MAAPGLAAVFFDLDGVLVDSFHVWLEVVNAARVRFGHAPIAEAHLRRIFGQGIGDDLQGLYPGQTRAQVLEAYDEAMPRALPRMRVNPTAVPALQGLRERGLARAVVTNTQASLAGTVLATMGLAAHLETHVAVAPGLREKPAPDLLQAALERLGLAPSQVLMVGDTDYDEQAARAAGTHFLRYEIRSGTSLVEALQPHLPPPAGGPPAGGTGSRPAPRRPAR